MNPPGEDSQHQVQDEERADDDERDEVEPVPVGAQGIVGLKHQTSKSARSRLMPPLGDESVGVWVAAEGSSRRVRAGQRTETSCVLICSGLTGRVWRRVEVFYTGGATA